MDVNMETVAQTPAPAEADPWAEALAEQAAATASGMPTADETSQTMQTAAKQPVFEQFSAARAPQAPNGAHHDINLILDIPVQLTVELGRTRVAIKQVLSMAQGSVIELDGLAGEPMDLMVNGCLIAQGEVVVVNEKFGIRLTDIVTPSERIRRLQR